MGRCAGRCGKVCEACLEVVHVHVGEGEHGEQRRDHLLDELLERLDGPRVPERNLHV